MPQEPPTGVVYKIIAGIAAAFICTFAVILALLVFSMLMVEIYRVWSEL